MTLEEFRQLSANSNNWVSTGKRDYDIYVSIPVKGTEVHNYLEGSDYITSDKKPFVLHGTVGEEWTIDGKKLAKTYEFMDGTPITAKELLRRVEHTEQGDVLGVTHIRTKRDNTPDIIEPTNFAIFIPKEIENFPVQTSWGEILLANRPEVPHGEGDFLVCAMTEDGKPNLQDVWVVNGEVFTSTYDLSGFDGIEKTVVEATPIPNDVFGMVVLEGKTYELEIATEDMTYQGIKIKPGYLFGKDEDGRFVISDGKEITEDSGVYRFDAISTETGAVIKTLMNVESNDVYISNSEVAKENEELKTPLTEEILKRESAFGIG